MAWEFRVCWVLRLDADQSVSKGWSLIWGLKSRSRCVGRIWSFVVVGLRSSAPRCMWTNKRASLLLLVSKLLIDPLLMGSHHLIFFGGSFCFDQLKVNWLGALITGAIFSPLLYFTTWLWGCSLLIFPHHATLQKRDYTDAWVTNSHLRTLATTIYTVEDFLHLYVHSWSLWKACNW